MNELESDTDQQLDDVLTPEEARRSLKSVWFLLLLSLPVYAAVAVVLEPPPEFNPAEHASWTMAAVFGGLAAASLAAIPILRKIWFFDPLENGEIDERSEEFLGELRTTWAMTWALATSISVWGLLAYFFVFELWLFALFFVPSVVLFIVFRPPYDRIEQMERPAGPYENR